MKNTNLILNLDFIQENLENLKKLEDDRIYCRHNLTHFFDVARICYILCLENNLKVNKDMIYTTAILHDLGREKQITEGISHDIASSEIAKRALKFTDFSEDEKKEIIDAILNHRNKSDELTFKSLFYKADKLSRDCFNCKTYDSCNWSNEKKNNEIKY